MMDSAGAMSASDSRAALRPFRAQIIVAMGGSLLPMLDTTIVNLSLEPTARDLGGMAQIHWVVTAYLVAFCAIAPAAGWLVSRYGGRRVLAAAATVFLVATIVCALAPNLTWLISSRAIAGASGGILIPASALLLTQGVPEELRGALQGRNGVARLAMPLIGPAVGGVVLHFSSWHAVYWVNVPFCLVVIALSLRLPKAEPEDRHAPFDAFGFGLLATFVVCAVLMVDSLTDHAISRRSDLALLLVVVASLGALVWHTRRVSRPVTDLSLFKVSLYAAAGLALLANGFVMTGPLVVIPLYLQNVRDFGPLVTGLLMASSGIGVFVAGRLVQKWTWTYGAGPMAAAGVVICGVGTVPFLVLGDSPSIWFLLTGLVVRGFGLGLTIYPLVAASYLAVQPQQMPSATAQVELIRRFGGSLAVAFMTVAVTSEARSHGGLSPEAFSDSFVVALALSGISLCSALYLWAVEIRRKRQSAAPTTGDEKEDAPA